MMITSFYGLVEASPSTAITTLKAEDIRDGAHYRKSMQMVLVGDQRR